MAVLREVITMFGLGTDKSSFRSAESRTQKLRSGITSLARVLATGAVANQLRGIVTETARLGDSIDKTSSKIGVETDALQELRFAAELAGVAQTTTDMALQRFGRRAAEAANETGAAQDALKELGVELKDSNGKLRPTEELLGDVADGLKGAATDGDRLRLAFKLFDSEGVAFINALKGGKEELEAVRAEARALGGIMDTELIALSVEYTDEQTRLGRVIRGVKNEIARGMLPAIIDTIKATIEWVAANREVISDTVVRGVRFFMGILRTMLSLIVPLVTSVENFATAFGELGGKVALVTGLFIAMALAMGLPVALGIAIIAIFEDLIGFFEGKNSLTGRFADFVSMLVENPIDPESHWAVQLFQGILKAIQDTFDEWERFKANFDFDERFSELGRTFRAIGTFGLSEAAGAGEGFVGAANPVQQLGDVATSLASQVTVHQTINAAPGQSEESIGGASGRAIEGVIAEQNRRAIRSHVPQPAS
jgi:hypothetical protein